MGMKATGNSKQDLVNYMTGANRTRGWDALIAFDRATINNTFRQQYIDSFSNDSYLPPINLSTQLSGDLHRVMEHCVFARPLIAFQNASILNANPTLDVEMEMIQGTELSVVYGAGKPKAVKMSYVSALNAPRLNFKAHLEKVKGLGGALAAVIVDLKNGTDYALSSGTGLTEPALLGNALRDEFARWRPVQRQWVANRVQHMTGGWAVRDFHTRCQPAPGAALGGAENYGDGSVVLFVMFVGGGTAGTFPTTEASFKYLVPNDDADKYTVTTIINSAQVAAGLGREVLTAYLEGPIAQSFIALPPVPGDVVLVRYITGAFHRLGSFTGPGVPPVYEVAFQIAPLGGWNLRAGVGGLAAAEASMSYDGRAFGGVLLYFVMNDFIDTCVVRNNDYLPDYVQVELNGGFIIGADLVFDVQHQRFGLAVVENKASLRATDMGDFNVIPRAEFLSGVTRIANAAATAIGESLAQREVSLSLLPLNGLLFSDAYQTQLTEARRPFDLLMLGHVARNANAFEIEPAMLTLLAGGAWQFTVSGQTGVTWSVRNLPGEEAQGAGIILPQTGIYAAPNPSDFVGPQVRVIVTATNGEASASTLVTIVRKFININPLVQFVEPGGFCDLAAGALGNDSPVWALGEGARGTLSNSPLARYDKRYTAPTADPALGLELVPVTVSVYASPETACIGVLHYPALLTLEAGPIDVAGRTVTIEAILGLASVQGCTWAVAAGSGMIDPQTGVLVADEDPLHPFVLITAQYMSPMMHGFLLLPLPLAEFPARPASPTRSRQLSDSQIVALA